MRGSFDALCGIVRDKMGRSPTSGEVYIFVNRRRTQIKLLHWEYGGFVMYYKRLERGNFELPSIKQGHFTWTELVMMIEGVSMKEVRMRPRYVLNKSA
jgi:transposase